MTLAADLDSAPAAPEAIARPRPPAGMRLEDLVSAAIGSLVAHPLRSVLTALGVVIGTAAVIVMSAIGAGAQKSVNDTISQIGANMLMITNGASRQGGVSFGQGGEQNLTRGDAQAIRERVANIVAVSASIRGAAQAVAGGANWLTQVEGVEAGYFEVNDWKLAEGRFFDEREVRSSRKVGIVGKTVAENLFGAASPIGQRIRLGRTQVEVIGVFEPKGQSGWGQDRDDIVIVPITVAQGSIVGRSGSRADGVQRIQIEGSSADVLPQVIAETEEVLRARHRIRPGADDDFTVRNITEFASAQADVTRTFGILLSSIAGVSLLVGGIGIMNIMLVSVTERTREIGLRIALGAKRAEVRAQFALEATVLSLAGGVIGVALGLLAGLVMAKAAKLPLLIDPVGVFTAFAVSALVGLVFGFWPASRAAAMDPIEALRRQ